MKLFLVTLSMALVAFFPVHARAQVAAEKDIGRSAEAQGQCSPAQIQEKLAADVKLDKNIAENTERLNKLLNMQDKLLADTTNAQAKIHDMATSPRAQFFTASYGANKLADHMPELRAAQEYLKSTLSLLESVSGAIAASTAAVNAYLKVKADIAAICASK